MWMCRDHIAQRSHTSCTWTSCVCVLLLFFAFPHRYWCVSVGGGGREGARVFASRKSPKPCDSMYLLKSFAYSSAPTPIWYIFYLPSHFKDIASSPRVHFPCIRIRVRLFSAVQCCCCCCCFRAVYLFTRSHFWCAVARAVSSVTLANSGASNGSEYSLSPC